MFSVLGENWGYCGTLKLLSGPTFTQYPQCALSSGHLSQWEDTVPLRLQGVRSENLTPYQVISFFQVALAKPLSPPYVFSYCLQSVKTILVPEGRGILRFHWAVVGRDGSGNRETHPCIQPKLLSPYPVLKDGMGENLQTRSLLHFGAGVKCPPNNLSVWSREDTLPTGFPFDPL